MPSCSSALGPSNIATAACIRIWEWEAPISISMLWQDPRLALSIQCSWAHVSWDISDSNLHHSARN
jgi:hypothetical protein